MSTTPALRIDFVSDISCPWCAIGLSSLEQALKEVGPEVPVSIHFQPFELNPQMGPGGQDVTEHLTQKYGSTPEQQAASREAIRQRGEAVGFTFRKEGRGRIYNTFNAHRLLMWAEGQGEAAQAALKKALLKVVHTTGESAEDVEVLVRAVTEAGLDAERARVILAGDEFAAEVREREAMYTGAGIHAVPAVILGERYLIQGGQPPEVFADALRQAWAELQAEA